MNARYGRQMTKARLYAFGLRKNDVKENTAGRLAGVQKRELTRRMVRVLVAVLFLCILLSIIVRIVETSIGLFTSWIEVIFGVVILERSIRFVQLGIDLVLGRVQRVDGCIRLQPLFPTVARMQIQNHKFRITTAQLLALRNGWHYVAYFSPYSKILMAAVPVREEEIEDTEIPSSELRLDDEKPKRGQVALGDDGELINIDAPKQRGEIGH